MIRRPCIDMRREFQTIQFYFFIGLLVVSSVAFFIVIKPLLYPLFWAAILAWMFYPLYKKIYKHFIPHKPAAALMTITLIVLIFLVPFIMLTSLVIQQSFFIYRSSEVEISNTLEKIQQFFFNFENLSLVRFIEESGIDWREKIVESIKLTSEYIFTGIRGLTSGTIRVVVGFFIMLYALYYLLQDGEEFLKKILRLSPLGDKSEIMIYDRFTSAIRATLKGSLLVAVIQGVLSGVIFWIAGIIAPVFWGVIMTVLALIPSLGPGLLAFPAGIILLVTGKIWQGIFVLIFGVGLVSVIDNLLRPYLVGRDIRMHPLFIFFSTIGGLVVFGVSGFVIGPIVASIFIAMWSIYEDHFRINLDKNRKR